MPCTCRRPEKALARLGSDETSLMIFLCVHKKTNYLQKSNNNSTQLLNNFISLKKKLSLTIVNIFAIADKRICISHMLESRSV